MSGAPQPAATASDAMIATGSAPSTRQATPAARARRTGRSGPTIASPNGSSGRPRRSLERIAAPKRFYRERVPPEEATARKRLTRERLRDMVARAFPGRSRAQLAFAALVALLSILVAGGIPGTALTPAPFVFNAPAVPAQVTDRDAAIEVAVVALEGGTPVAQA